MISSAITSWVTHAGQSRAVENFRAAESVLRLLEAYREARQPGWYAGEGEPISQGTFLEARRFLGALPEFFRPTDIDAEPDGGLAFEWYGPDERVMIVSFDGHGRAIYTIKLSDKDREAGQVPFHDRIPQVIAFHLQRFFSNGANS